MSRRQQQVLNYIYWHRIFEHPVTMRGIAKHLDVSFARIWQLLHRLQRAGFVTWKPMRNNTIMLTDLGARHVYKAVTIDSDAVRTLKEMIANGEQRESGSGHQRLF